jgi:enoyl-[acyl-carrier protein] reductase III
MVIVNYLENEKAAEAIRSEIESMGVRCLLVKANLQFADEVDRLFECVRAHCERVHYFVHCAALNAFKPLIEVKPNQWDMTMNINARSFLLCAQHLCSLMSSGSVVAISSLGSSRAVPNYGAMGPTKAALESMVRSLAVELAPRGIRVNAVSGGVVDTESIQKFPHAERLVAEIAGRIPAMRIGTPEDIAGAVAFLLSPSASWMYGQTVVVDGGMSII